MWPLRSALASFLRKAANALCEDTTYRCFPGYFNFVPGKGLVITQTDGVPGDMPGAPLYLREDEYERAHQ